MMQILQRSAKLSGDAGLAQIAVTIVFGTTAIAAVILRLVSRRVSRVYLEMNDWMIVLALISTLCSLSAIITSVVRGGSGKHQDQLSPNDIEIYWKSMFVLYITWPITQTAIKVSILLFYSKIFVTRSFQIAAYTVIAVVCIWCFQQVLAAVLICKPISLNWNFNQEGHCGNIMANCLAGAAINVVTDLVILALPMPTIWRLNVPLKSKLSLSFIFGLGFLICIVSMIRFKGLVSWTVEDGTYKNSMAMLWTSLESMLGVICACIVVMRPLFGKVFPERLKVSKKPSNKNVSTDPSTSSGSRLSRMLSPTRQSHQLSGKPIEPQTLSGPGKFQRLEEESFPHPSNFTTREHLHLQPTHTATVEAQNTNRESGDHLTDVEAQNPARSLSPGAIMVKREWEVDSLRI